MTYVEFWNIIKINKYINIIFYIYLKLLLCFSSSCCWSRNMQGTIKTKHFILQDRIDNSHCRHMLRLNHHKEVHFKYHKSRIFQEKRNPDEWDEAWAVSCYNNVIYFSKTLQVTIKGLNTWQVIPVNVLNHFRMTYCWKASEFLCIVRLKGKL